VENAGPKSEGLENAYIYAGNNGLIGLKPFLQKK